MDEFEMKRRIYGYIKEICHYSQMQVFATSYYQKNYFQMQIDDASSAMISLYMDLSKSPEHQRRSHSYRYQTNDIENYEQILQPGDWEQPSSEQEQPSPGQSQQPPRTEQPGIEQEQVPGSEESSGQEQVSFTVEELAYYDGTSGKPAYVAVNGVVYDVSAVVRWAGGRHFGMQAGKNLSAAFMGCHQGIMDRLNKLPKVGTLEKGV
ncbi:MAG: heme/steroid binding protein [Herbinix sp.]|jgi:predicted heme/steroid binding protein|nr:heme/steroid binding protein [Herbinix sp.]